jgi:hypothetical protein
MLIEFRLPEIRLLTQGGILGDGRITAPQFFQGADPMLSVVHAMELVAA